MVIKSNSLMFGRAICKLSWPHQTDQRQPHQQHTVSAHRTVSDHRIGTRLAYGLGFLLIALISGCQTTTALHQTALSHFDSGDPIQAIQALTKAQAQQAEESEILQTDLAIAQLMAGHAKQTERQLKAVQAELDYLAQKDIKEQTLALLSDSRSIAYSGREFEKEMIRNLLTLSSMVSDRHDTFAFAGQAMEVVTADFQQRISIDHPSEQGHDADFTSSPTLMVSHQQTSPPEPNSDAQKSGHSLAAYLHALVHSENPLDHQLTQNSIQQIDFWSTERTQSAPPAFGTMTPKQHGSLHVITFTDRITDWVPEKAQPTSVSLLLADQILSKTGKHSLPPTIAPVKIAKPANPQCLNPFVTAVQIANQTPLLHSQPLIDLNHAAWDSYEADRNQQLASAVVRRIVKKAAIYTVKDQISVQGGSEVDTLLNLTGVLWESLEKADTRHVALLPGRIEVVNTVLPVGQHNVQLNAAVSQSDLHSQQHINKAPVTVPITIQNGRNTVILCFRIGHRYVGNIMINDGTVIPLHTSL